MDGYTSKNLDRLGIVYAICSEINLAEEIDSAIAIDPRQKVTYGQEVIAMVLNCLGFVDRPLYLFPEFMRTDPIEILTEKGLKSEYFNDDCMGRTLDKLQSYGCEELFIGIAANVYKYAVKSSFFHSDTTSMSVEGDYEHEEGDIDAVPIKITYGYSKDHRPYLKQFVISLITSKELPVFIQTLGGNTSDKNHFRELTKGYGGALQNIWGEDRI